MFLKRHAAAVALCELVPVPFLDTVLQNHVRRSLVRFNTTGLGDAEVVDLADEPMNLTGRMLWWPAKAIAKKVFFFWTPVEMVRMYRQTLELGNDLGA